MPRDRATPVFVVDEDAGPSVAEGIRDAGGLATLLTDHVGRGTPDVDWLPRVAEWGSAIVTRDVAMRRNPEEALALERSGVHVFILRAKGFRADELRDLIRRSYPAMARYVRKQRTPFLARITASRIEVLTDRGRTSAEKKP